MRRSLLALWNDEGGFIITAELVLISTLLVIGLVAGLACLRAALIGELEDVAGAIGSLNQSYWYKGYSGRAAWNGCYVKSATAGSRFVDRADGGIDIPNDISGCQTVPAQPTPKAATPVVPAPAATPCPGGPCLEAPANPSTPCPTCGPSIIVPGTTKPLEPSADPKSVPMNSAPANPPANIIPPTNTTPAPAPDDAPTDEKRPPAKPISA
ncbi:MAG: hypothetical protein IT428_10075 [Planctomycetaceae bacterium]|nr:hypothetical protein [Planctomycetaceae bacterium]